MFALPASPSAATPEWLGDVLRPTLPDLPQISAVEWELIGQGFGLTGIIARLRLRYAHQAGDAPDSLILKLPMAMPESASLYREAQSIDDEANRRYFARCAREVGFYRSIEPTVPGVAPHPYFAEVDESQQVIVILLEDLTGARAGDVLAGCSVEDAHTLIGQIARIHAQWWDRETFRWLPRSGGENEARQERLARQIGTFLDRWGPTIPPEIVAIIERLGVRYAALLNDLDRRPSTIIHADLHLDNVLFDAPTRIELVILDWQNVCRGPSVVDIGRFVAESLTPDDRRRHEAELLADYHARLVAGGVMNYTFDQLRHDYRLSLCRMLAGAVGWLANTDANRLQGREKQLVEAAFGDGRLNSALVDHDILGLLTDE